jgi:DNA-binding TFAR19-related protein (PDSD5 family)
MYTIYSDLLTEGKILENNLIVNKLKVAELSNKQKERDQYIKQDLNTKKIKFPINEENVSDIIPYFLEKTSQNKLLNFLLVKKDLEQKDVEVKVISNNSINICSTQSDAMDLILQCDNKPESYAFLYNKMC